MEAEELQNYLAQLVLDVWVLNTKVDFDNLENPIKTRLKSVDTIVSLDKE